MIITFASGKGGTGKTTVAVNLAAAAADAGNPCVYVDADVEEPNGELFFHPEIHNAQRVNRLVPIVNAGRCTLCGACSDLCAYGAIAVLGKKVMVFPELCHSCGGCARVCPEKAISEERHVIGEVRTGSAKSVYFVTGALNVGEAMAPPVIHAARKAVPNSQEWVFVDSPPGTACPAVAALHGSDFVVLVAEPTLFGLHDLKLAVDLVREMSLPFAVVINRADIGDRQLVDWCRSEGIQMLGEIPEDREAAECISRGELLYERLPRFRTTFDTLLLEMQKAAAEVVTS